MTVPAAEVVYEAELRGRDVKIEDVVTTMTAVNRGSWGERRFSARDWRRAPARAETGLS